MTAYAKYLLCFCAAVQYLVAAQEGRAFQRGKEKDEVAVHSKTSLIHSTGSLNSSWGPDPVFLPDPADIMQRSSTLIG